MKPTGKRKRTIGDNAGRGSTTSDSRPSSSSNEGTQDTPSPPRLPSAISEDELRAIYHNLGIEDAYEMSAAQLRETGIKIAQGVFGDFPRTGGLQLADPELMGSQWIAQTFASGMMDSAFDDDEEYPESVREFVPEESQSYKGAASRRWKLIEPPVTPPNILRPRQTE
ncbi:uncharacterized protein N7477_006363 [Penicillium maclennaniae]|uniref:uncharacterized protein n=1 Tax=Penicillium maclennaniae TaxID=1343394 RepID=UPI002540CA37|nr:uncharacterized protein N7477_006363 [Penicillium maclennaniae]KAJ5667793.1 hypothetical protein N7477_006363 [Penicillium maclennaniae]